MAKIAATTQADRSITITTGVSAPTPAATSRPASHDTRSSSSAYDQHTPPPHTATAPGLSPTCRLNNPATEAGTIPGPPAGPPSAPPAPPPPTGCPPSPAPPASSRCQQLTTSSTVSRSNNSPAYSTTPDRPPPSSASVNVKSNSSPPIYLSNLYSCSTPKPGSSNRAATLFCKISIVWNSG